METIILPGKQVRMHGYGYAQPELAWPVNIGGASGVYGYLSGKALRGLRKRRLIDNKERGVFAGLVLAIRIT